jgi:hypothetical protein
MAMKKSIQLLGILSLCALGAQAAELPAPTCEEIRVQIQAQTGLLPQANVDLLRTIGLHQQCQFTAAEVYRGAYGDKPLPVQAPPARHRSHDQEDD